MVIVLNLCATIGGTCLNSQLTRRASLGRAGLPYALKCTLLLHADRGERGRIVRT